MHRYRRDVVGKVRAPGHLGNRLTLVAGVDSRHEQAVKVMDGNAGNAAHADGKRPGCMSSESLASGFPENLSRSFFKSNQAPVARGANFDYQCIAPQ